MTTTQMPIQPFFGDFDLLPIGAHLRFGAVPRAPTSDDFQLAACLCSELAEEGCAYAAWHIEAVRERRLNPGVALSGEVMHRINTRVAARLYELRGA